MIIHTRVSIVRHREPFDLGYEALRVCCLISVLVHLIRFRAEGAYRLLREKLWEFFPHEVSRLLDDVRVRQDLAPELFQLLYPALVLVNVGLKIALISRFACFAAVFFSLLS